MNSMELVNKIYSKEEWRKLIHFVTHNFHLWFWNLEFLSYAYQQKIALPQQYVEKEKSLKSKFELVNAHKYISRKCLRKLKDELIISKNVNKSLSVENLLKDTVIETIFPNTQQLLKIYVLIPGFECELVSCKLV